MKATAYSNRKTLPDKRFVLKPLAAAVLTALSPATRALAQEAKPVGLEEVVVTATRRELDLQDVAQSITAFSTADLEKMGVKTMEDYVAALPSVVMRADRPGRNNLIMRGIVAGIGDVYLTPSQVGLYLDEQPMHTPSQQISVRAIDMERIEALPGPQGTLFGSSSQAGTMRLITNKPNFAGFSGQIDTSVGTTKGGDPSYDVSGHLNIPVLEDKLAIRVVGYKSYDGGYVDIVPALSYSGTYDNADVVENNANTYEVIGGRIAALWNLSDEWSALFSLVSEETELHGAWETDPYIGKNKIVRFTDEFMTDEWYSAAMTLSGDMGFASLSATVTHLERDITYFWENEAYAEWRGSYYNDNSLYDTGYTYSELFNFQPQGRDAVEIRMASQGESKLQWVAGAYYEDATNEWYYGASHPGTLTSSDAWATAQTYACYYAVTYPQQACPLAPTDVWYASDLDEGYETKALFGQISYELTEKIGLTFGARWNEFGLRREFRYALPEGLPVGLRDDNGTYRYQDTTDNMLYKFSIDYFFDDQRMVYFLFSQGSRPGGSNSPRAADTGVIPPAFEADYMDNYEVGIKSTWLGNRLQVNAQLFMMKWSDFQVYDSPEGSPWWLNGTLNGETAQTDGLEINVKWQATANLTVNGALTLQDARFTEDATVGNTDYFDGMGMPNSPDEKAYLGINYDLPELWGHNAWLWYDISYEGSTWNTTSNVLSNYVDGETEGFAPSKNISNFQAGIAFDNDLDMTLRVDNVWDQTVYYIVNTSDNFEAGYFGSPRGLDQRTLVRPRTIWLNFRKGFGQ